MIHNGYSYIYGNDVYKPPINFMTYKNKNNNYTKSNDREYYDYDYKINKYSDDNVYLPYNYSSIIHKPSHYYMIYNDGYYKNKKLNLYNDKDLYNILGDDYDLSMCHYGLCYGEKY